MSTITFSPQNPSRMGSPMMVMMYWVLYVLRQHQIRGLCFARWRFFRFLAFLNEPKPLSSFTLNNKPTSIVQGKVWRIFVIQDRLTAVLISIKFSRYMHIIWIDIAKLKCYSKSIYKVNNKCQYNFSSSRQKIKCCF